MPVRFGTNPIAWSNDDLRTLGGTTPLVTCLAEARRPDWSFLDSVVAGVFTVPGDGAVDFPAVLGALPGYAGWLVVEAEQDPAKAEPLAYAALGCRNLKAYACGAGLAP